MIDSKIAANQIQRLGGLSFFPKEAPAQKELRLALEAASSERLATQIITDILAEFNDCPKPADLRRMVYERNDQDQTERKRCALCFGNSFVTEWFLVTYKGNSFIVDKIERLDATDEREAWEFASKIAEAHTTKHQTVVSGAKECPCVKQGPIPERPVVAGCYHCGDSGIVESISASDYRSVASYCDCVAGRERIQRPKDTHSVARVNQARKVLLATYKTDPLEALRLGKKPDRRVEEVYRGEF